MYRKYQHKLSPATLCEGTTKYVATEGRFTFAVEVKSRAFSNEVMLEKLNQIIFNKQFI